MPAKTVNDYYIRKKARLMKNFDEHLRGSRDLLARKYNDAKIDEIQNHMKEEFENLIPQIPYIGGSKNIYTVIQIQTISNLAIFRILEYEGLTYREIGEFFYELADGLHRIRKEHLERIGKDPANAMFEPIIINQLKFRAEISQKRVFPFDWVLKFVEGDGISFDYGLDISECGVYKLFKELGAEKYVPFQCMNRVREANIFGYGLFRNQTLATGAPKCEYRYIKKLKTPQKITEEEVTYYKEKKICLVCKGNIEGFNNFICPKCEVLYCENCARTLIELENACWVCDAPLDKSKPSKSSKRKEDEFQIKKSSQIKKK